MKRIMSIALLFIVAFVYEAYPENENRWELIRSENGIAVYKRLSLNSKLNETMAVTVIDSAIEIVAEVLGDIEGQPQWMDAFKEARLVKNLGVLNNIVYYYIDSPWPVEDRDVVVTAKGEIDVDTARVVIKGHAICDTSVPKKKNCIRMSQLTSAWVLECVLEDRNKTKVYYTSMADPAGLIPPFFANLGMKEQPFKTLTAMSKKVKEQKYIDLGNKAPGKKLIDGIYNNPALIKKAIENRKKITPEMMMKQ